MLNSLEKIFETWLFKKKESDVTLNSFYNSIQNVDFSGPINAFTSRLSSIECNFSKSEQVSGSICFFGGIFTSLLHYGYIENIEGLFTFALCYMLIDHFLDDKNISKEEKDKSMKEIYEFMIYEKKSDNPLLKAASERYLHLINTTSCKPLLLRLFQSELKGVEIQRRKDLPRETYLQIAEEKGGLTAAVIGNIIGITEEESYPLGSVIQITDDILDLKDDLYLNIYTLARYDYDRGSLDEYVYYTCQQIENLSNVYNFFKPILLLGLILGIHDNRDAHNKCVSDELWNLLDRYNLFSENTSKDYLNEWFHEKLYSYIEMNL